MDSETSEKFRKTLEELVEKDQPELTDDEVKTLRQMIAYWAGFRTFAGILSVIARFGIWIFITLGALIGYWPSIKAFFSGG